MAFYQACVGVFAVLVVTGVVGEFREIRTRLRSEDEPMSDSLKAQIAGATVLLLLGLVGAFLSLLALSDPPAGDLERVGVIFCLAATGIGLPLLVLASLREHRLKESRRLTRMLLAVLSSLLLGVVVYAVAIVTDEDGPAVYTYHVYGTCTLEACGLNEYAGPSVRAEPLGQLRDGDEVEIVCQVKGGMGVTPTGVRSNIWNQLSNGAFVSDVAVDTPPVGGRIPACE